MINRLLLYAEKKGYKIKRLRRGKLYIQFDLYIDGKHCTQTHQYQAIGEYWEKLGGVWGGRFVAAEGNSFYFNDGRMK